MNTLLKDWNIIRILRLIAGIVIIGMAIAESQIILSIIGLLLLIQAVMNTGCGANGCNNVSADRRYRRKN